MSPCQEAKRGCAKDLGGGNWRGTGLAAPIRGLDGLIDPRAPVRGRREICYTGCIPAATRSLRSQWPVPFSLSSPSPHQGRRSALLRRRLPPLDGSGVRRADPLVADAPANLGGIWTKGATLGQVIQTPDRLVMPQLRTHREKERRPVGWAEALTWVSGRFHEIIRKHGPHAVASCGSGQLDSEVGYLAVKLFKGSIGTNNTDSNSRLCMAAAVAGYRTSLGADGPPTCYADIDLSDCMVVWGSNMAEAFPVTFDRVRARLKANPEVDLIVVDPRRTNTAEVAKLHVPVAPGGDIPLMNAVGRLLIERDAVDRRFVEDHTEGFEAYRDFLLQADWREMVEASGVSEALVRTLAARIAGARRWLTFYCQGLNQSTVGMWKNNSVINLHLLTGQIGKPGAGPFSLTGQPNAMGGREVGLLAQALPGYRFTEDPGHRAEVEEYWGRAEGTISARPGLTAVEMFRALEAGRLKAIWIAATNPAVSLPDLHHVRRALAKAELIVVQDPYHPTETSLLADVLLPTAQWAEKTFTSTNSERLVSYSEQVINPPGLAWPDWQIIARFGEAMGYPGFDFQDSSQVWDEFIALTAGRPCDMSGMTSARLRASRHLHWPCPERRPPWDGAALPRPKFSDPERPGPIPPQTAPAAEGDHRPRVPAGPDDRTDLRPLAHDDPHGQIAQARPARAVGLRRGPPR